MSDIYLTLRERIPTVAAKTQIGTARLQEAQDAIGLSNERVARLVPVSEKTWRRWKEAGEVPTASLPAVARALNLEIVGASPDRLTVVAAGEHDDGELVSLRSEVRELRSLLEQVLERLPEQH